jgi:predicted nucleic acid-binding protein
MNAVFLLDVNVLIAIADSRSVHRDLFLDWYRKMNFPAIATCPITENGFLRIFGHPEYPGGPGSVAEAAKFLSGLKMRPNYHFVPDDFSLLDTGNETLSIKLSSKNLTDLYLAGLCFKHAIRFATFDRRISVKETALSEVVEFIG